MITRKLPNFTFQELFGKYLLKRAFINYSNSEYRVEIRAVGKFLFIVSVFVRVCWQDTLWNDYSKGFGSDNEKLVFCGLTDRELSLVDDKYKAICIEALKTRYILNP